MSGSTPAKSDASAPFVFTPPPGAKPFVFGPTVTPTPAEPFIFGTPATTTTSTNSTPFVFGTPATTTASSSTTTPFNFDAPATALPSFSIGTTPQKSAEDDEDGESAPTTSASKRQSKNPFGAEVKRRQAAPQPTDEEVEDGEIGEDDENEYDDGDNEDEDGEDEEGEDDEGDDGEDDEEMDEDDEGDLPYPIHEKGPTTVECEQCGEYIPKKELATHQTRVCSETPMECPFADLHCGATAVNRRLLRAHLNRNMSDHVVWLMTQVDEQRKLIQSLSESLEDEKLRRRAVEEAIQALGGELKVHDPFTTRRSGVQHNSGREASHRMIKAGLPSGGKQRQQGGGGQHGASSSPPLNGRGATSNELPKFTISFDATKPLDKSDHRWTPHSLAMNDAFVLTAPKSLAGTGNKESEEQTRLKIAAGLLPASALKSPLKPAAAASSTTSATRLPGAPDDLAALTKQLKSVFNKLTAQNFEKLSKQVVDILKTVTTEATLTSLVVLLFDKAVLDSYFSNIYSMLCAEISTNLPPINGDANKAFKRFLLNQCQVEFEAGVGDLTKHADETDEAFIQRKTKQKQRMLGTIRFIGELFKKDLILQQIMQFCIMHLLPHLDWKRAPTSDSTPTSDEPSSLDQEQSDSIEAFCKLLITIGSKFEQVESGKQLFDTTVFPKIASCESNKAMPSRLRFMLKDLSELRAKKWRTRAAAEQVVATSEKVVTTVEMGLGNGGVPVTSNSSSSGRGAVHDSSSSTGFRFLDGAFASPQQHHQQQHGSRSGSSSIQSSPGLRPTRATGGHIHHDSHEQNSLYQAASQSSGKRGQKSGGGGGNRRGGGGGYEDNDGSNWKKGDRLGDSSSGRKSQSGGRSSRR